MARSWRTGDMWPSHSFQPGHSPWTRRHVSELVLDDPAASDPPSGRSYVKEPRWDQPGWARPEELPSWPTEVCAKWTVLVEGTEFWGGVLCGRNWHPSGKKCVMVPPGNILSYGNAGLYTWHVFKLTRYCQVVFCSGSANLHSLWPGRQVPPALNLANSRQCQMFSCWPIW